MLVFRTIDWIVCVHDICFIWRNVLWWTSEIYPTDMQPSTFLTVYTFCPDCFDGANVALSFEYEIESEAHIISCLWRKISYHLLTTDRNSSRRRIFPVRMWWVNLVNILSRTVNGVVIFTVNISFFLFKMIIWDYIIFLRRGGGFQFIRLTLKHKNVIISLTILTLLLILCHFGLYERFTRPWLSIDYAQESECSDWCSALTPAIMKLTVDVILIFH